MILALALALQAQAAPAPRFEKEVARFEAADRMRRALSRGKRPHAEKVADGLGAHCDATGKDQKHCIESQRPRSQLLVRSHRISLGIVCKIMDGAFHRC